MRVLFALLIPALLYAWEGKIVGVSDGDTIKVLKDGRQVKIRPAAAVTALFAGLENQ